MSVVEKIKQEIIQSKKNGLLVGNPVYKPFRYPWCYDAWLTQQRIHWLPEEVPLGDDKSNLDMIKKIRFFGQSKKLSKVLIDQI